jgi:PAS domain S-box-containing protein
VGQVGSWQLDIRHDILTWSDEGYRIFGIPKGTPLTYEVFLATVHPEDRQYVDTQWNASLKGQPYDLEHRIIVNGEVKWVREKAFLERDADGNLVGGFGITQDVTQRRRAEEALRESEARFRILADGTPVVIWVHDKEAGLQFINRAYCEFFGVTVEQVAGGNWKPLVHPDDAPDYVGSFMNCHAQRREFHSQARVRRHDGQWRWIESSGAPRFSETGEYLGMAGSSVDITVRKEAEAVLARSKAELERLVAERTAKLQELVGELEHFSYTITHDMRAPLRTMRGFGQIVSEMCDEWGKTEAKDFLGRIMNSADRMDALIRDALNYSQTVRQELPLDDVDTGVLVRGMVDTYPELQACKANIHIEGKLPVVLGNEAGLTQCFSNLLGNAVKFVKPGQTPEIRIWAEERAGWARIWVEDNGIGISKDMLPRVFDMFSRASRSYEGTGIGLALVRKVSQRMGGRAGVESEEGKGSRFWVELKAGKTKPAAKVPESTAAEPSAGTVLYVEDDEGDALFMERAFTKKGLGSALRLVGDGRAAIEYLSGAGKYLDRRAYPLPAVVLLDLNLPEVPGFEVLKWMRNHPDFSATPVVVFSSSSRQDDQLKARELGANEFVAKPKSGLEFGGVVDGLREKWLSQAKTERNDSPVCSEIRLAGGQTADILHNL